MGEGPSLAKKAYLWMGVITPIPSILMYVLMPGGTVKHFNGAVTNTSKFWCSVAASGDSVIAYLCAVALIKKSDEFDKIVVRGNFVYSIFHVGAFWYWHLHGEKHPSAVMYPLGLGVAVAALLAWGQ